MSWAGIANNQTVSFTNLKDAVDTGVFIQKIAQVVSNEQITKTDAINYVWVNTQYAPFAALTSNQLPVKTDMIRQCWCWIVTNDDTVTRNVTFTPCGTTTPVTIPIFGNGDFLRLCSNIIPTIDTFFSSVVICGVDGQATTCGSDDDCIGCADCGSPCGGSPY
jgi:hypothetical protein